MPVFSGKEKIVELKDLPQSDTGAPLPTVLATDYSLSLAYIADTPSPDRDGRTVQVVSETTGNESVVIVSFKRARAHYFGSPNDEALNGHPLYNAGLRSYSVFKVENSGWIAELEKRNSVHYLHHPKMFKDLIHYIFTFHDSTFECVAKGFSVTLFPGSLQEAISRMASMIGAEE